MKKIVNEKLSNRIFEFKKGLDPIDSLGINYSSELKKLQDKSKIDYLRENDFKDDGLIDFIFKKIYDKWINSQDSITPNDIKIWEDITSGGTPIIKLMAPKVRTVTILRGESYGNLVFDDILTLLNTKEIKQEIADDMNKDFGNIKKLTDMIFNNCTRTGLKLGSWMIASNIARRLIKMYQK